ncbi:MAG: PAS domain-containing protein [Planctomycetota bacterium]
MNASSRADQGPALPTPITSPPTPGVLAALPFAAAVVGPDEAPAAANDAWHKLDAEAPLSAEVWRGIRSVLRGEADDFVHVVPTDGGGGGADCERFEARPFADESGVAKVLVTRRPMPGTDPDAPRADDLLQTRAALREVHELFERFTANTSTIFRVIRWDQKRITYLSPAYEDVFGHPVQEVYDDPSRWVDGVHPEDRGRVVAELARAHERSLDRTYRIVRGDGEVRTIRDRTFPVAEASGPAQTVLGLAEDVTDRVRVEAEVLRSEERYRAAAEGGLDAFFLLDAVRDDRGEIVDFVFTDLNQNAARMVSRERDGVIGQRLCELLPINREPRFFGEYKRVVDTGERLSREFPINAQEMGIQANWMEQLVVPIGDGIAISARDVTQRKRVEQELQRQREENQTILDAIPAFVFYKDTENRILRVNRAVCEAQGLPLDQIEGRHSAELFPDDAEDYHRDDLAVIRSGKPKLGYVERAVFDGEEHWIRTDKVPLYGEDDEPQGVIAVCTDVTELLQTTQKLEESERRFRGLFDRVPVSVWEQDLSRVVDWLDGLKRDGVDDLGRYLEEHPEGHDHAVAITDVRSVNQATFDLMGAKDAAELIESMKHGHVGPPPEPLLLKLQTIWDGGTSAEMETYCYTVSGQKIYVLFRFEVPEIDGRPDYSRAIVALTDISENRRRLFVQAQVTQAERERLALSHELHDTLAQQLTGMNMLAESLRRRLASRRVDEAEARVGELAEMIHDANSEVRRLISGLSPETIAPHELETALESLAERTQLVHGLPVSFRCPRSPSELDEETANHLLFIAQEATHNAAKHARASAIEIALIDDLRGLRLVVSDDGVGLPDAKANPDIRPDQPGSGLGLGIMRYRADAVGGTLSLLTNEPRGTRVVCQLPADRVPDAAEEPRFDDSDGRPRHD